MKKPVSYYKTYLFLFLFACFFKNFSQAPIQELQRLTNLSLFDIYDTTCIDLSGEWIGEEIQYDPTQSFIKVKFKVVFNLKQEGNRVYGSSSIVDKYKGSYGAMKIRGLISGNKLYFEEYEIQSEKFFEKNVVWCLRAGEMTIETDENSASLISFDYKGYASDTYLKCSDFVKMSLSQKRTSKNTTSKINISKLDVVEHFNQIEKKDAILFPNPCNEQSTISFEMDEKSNVQIDIFSLSGAHLKNIISNQILEGKQQSIINISAFAPGIYLVRLRTEKYTITKQLIKTL